jgi:hypothetical protein
MLKQQIEDAVTKMDLEIGDEIERAMGFRPLTVWKES